MNSIRLKILKYLPLLSLLGFSGFIRTPDNHLDYSRFGFFVFISAYWEYKFLAAEPQKDLLAECYRKTKRIIYPFATIFFLFIIILFYFSWVDYNTLLDLATLFIVFLVLLGVFIPQRLYYKLSKK